MSYKSKLKNGNICIAMYVNRADSKPCNSFPYMYGFMDRSLLDVILYTCKKTEIPPKPSRNAERIIFMLIVFIGIIEICLIPLVISSIPVRMGVQKFVSRFSSLNIGELIRVNVLKIPLVFSIDIMLEKMMINPPIIRIVFVLLVMLSDRIFPKFDIVMLSVLDILGVFI